MIWKFLPVTLLEPGFLDEATFRFAGDFLDIPISPTSYLTSTVKEQTLTTASVYQLLRKAFDTLTHEHGSKHVSLQQHQQTNQRGERDAVKKDIAQDVALVSIPARRGAGHND